MIEWIILFNESGFQDERKSVRKKYILKVQKQWIFNGSQDVCKYIVLCILHV